MFDLENKTKQNKKPHTKKNMLPESLVLKVLLAYVMAT